MAGIEVIKTELEHFEKIKADLLKAHTGKFALIKGESLINTFTTRVEAYEEGIKQFGRNPFLVKLIVEKEEEQKIPALTANLINAHL